jgi:hypothetical protein
MTWRGEKSYHYRDSDSEPLAVQLVASRCTVSQDLMYERGKFKERESDVTYYIREAGQKSILQWSNIDGVHWQTEDCSGWSMNGNAKSFVLSLSNQGMERDWLRRSVRLFFWRINYKLTQCQQRNLLYLEASFTLINVICSAQTS